MRVLVTGGAGFVGSSLALALRTRFPNCQITAFDNLHRRGSELNLPVLRRAGIAFMHGDIRCPSDLAVLTEPVDLFIEASAEPSVHAGSDGHPGYVLDTNLGGTLHCLEWARKHAGFFVFLSTSRVYSLLDLKELPLGQNPWRFELPEGTQGEGWKAGRGIAEGFSTRTARSLYGATKLASEMLVQEYAHAYGLRSVINRCGVIAGPGQFGKVDQGVFTLWVASHLFDQALRYSGFGGTGAQVRDLLHPRDLFTLIEKQWNELPAEAPIFNVGGGLSGSVSLAEFTALCRSATGREVPIGAVPATNANDVPYYVSDNGRAVERYGWEPTTGPSEIVGEIAAWLKSDSGILQPLFFPERGSR